ncbi:MAG: tetratricopeptide repeat protein [Clostridia bacterium]|nr:tetratricopeptide repeat protein [Clostridia bacterium]
MQKKLIAEGVDITVYALAVMGAITLSTPVVVISGCIGLLYGAFKTIGILKNDADNLTTQQEKAIKSAIKKVVRKYKSGNKKELLNYLNILISDELKAEKIGTGDSIDTILANIKASLKKINKNESYYYTEKDINEFTTDFKLSLYKKLSKNWRIAITKLLVDRDFVKKKIKEHDDLLKDHEKRIKGLEQAKPYEFSLHAVALPQKITKLIGRQKEKNDINTILKSSSVLIKGMGGIGKSELARAICAERTTNSEKSGWFNFEQSLNNTIMKIANPSQMKTPQGIEIQHRLVKEYLLSLGDDYTIVFDNIEKLEKDETELLRSLHCKLIITTRSQFDGLDNIFEPYPLEAMSESDCKELFEHYSGRKATADEEKDLDNLINLTGGHTLVIELLAKMTKPPTAYKTITALYAALQESKFDLSALVSANGDTESKEFRKHMLKLYDVSKITDGSQIHVLKNICILPSIPMPYEKLCGWLSDSNKYDASIKQLYEAGWLKCEDNTITMHNVISETLKMRFENEIKFSDCKALLKSLDKEIDKDTDDPERYKAEYMPFCVSTAEYFKGIENDDIMHLYSTMANIYRDISEYQKAIDYNNRSLEINIKLYGEEHENVGAVYNNIAGVYKDMGDYPKALDYYKLALSIKEKVLGKDHPDTASTYNNIALLYADMGEYQKALDYYKLALSIVEKVPGKDHPYTASTYNNIAMLYQDMGDSKKALYYLNLALSIREKVLGKDHPDTAATYNNIALLYADMGEYQKALDHYKLALSVREKVLGKDHPSTASTYNNIAGVYKDMGDYPKALEYYNMDKDISEKVLGKDHPSTATAYNNIALLYKAMGDYQIALDYYPKSLYILLTKLGPEHPNTKTGLNNMAICYEESGADMDKFEEWKAAALKKAEKEIKK